MTISTYADVRFLCAHGGEHAVNLNLDFDTFWPRLLTSVVPKQKCEPHGGAKGIIKSWPQRAGIDPLATVSAVCVTIDPAGVSTGCHTDPKWTFTSIRKTATFVKIATDAQSPISFGFHNFLFFLLNIPIHPSALRLCKRRDAQEASGLCPFVASLQASSVCVSLRLCLLTPLSTPALPSILDPLLHPDSESVCHRGQ